MQNAAARNALRLEVTRPEMALLPFLIQQHLNREARAMPSMSDQLTARPSSATRCASGPYAVPLGKVYVTGGGALASSQPWDQEQLTIEAIRANPSIRGEPYYDFVSVVREQRPGSAGIGDQSWYAQLRCLFGYKPDTGPLPQKEMLLALVRWMVPAQTLVSDSLLISSGSKCLKWAQAPASHAKLRGQEAYFDIIDLDSIIRRESLIQDMRVRKPTAGTASAESTVQRYYTNPFLWARNR